MHLVIAEKELYVLFHMLYYLLTHITRTIATKSKQGILEICNLVKYSYITSFEVHIFRKGLLLTMAFDKPKALLMLHYSSKKIIM